MRPYHNSRESWSRVVSVVLLAIAMTSCCGCDWPHVLGSNLTVNMYVPLGLSGEPGLLNPTAAAMPSPLPSDAGTVTSPPVGGLFDSTTGATGATAA